MAMKRPIVLLFVLAMLLSACFVSSSVAFAESDLDARVRAENGVFTFTPREFVDALLKEISEPYDVNIVTMDDRYGAEIYDTSTQKAACTFLFATKDYDWIADPDDASIGTIALYCEGSSYFDISNEGVKQAANILFNTCNPGIRKSEGALILMMLMLQFDDSPVGEEYAGLKYILNYVDAPDAYLLMVFPA